MQIFCLMTEVISLIPVVVCYLLTRAWSAVWDWVMAWHWTPGWGNLSTVLVAVAAIVVSAWYNRRTLRNANTIFNQGRIDANAMFNQGRIDARNAEFREEIAGLMSASGESKYQQIVFLKKFRESTSELDDKTPEQRDALMRTLKADFSEVLGDAYNRIGVHMISAKLLLLNDDQTILGHLKEIEDLSDAQQEYIDSLIESVSLGDPSTVMDEDKERERNSLLEIGKGNLLMYLVNVWEPNVRKPHS